jgi:3-oxoadipate enol-lactonase
MRTQLASNFWMEREDTGTGSPLVLLHAFPLSRAMWQPQIEALRNDYRIIAPDLRGFGGTGPFDGPPSIMQMADDVARLLDKLSLAKPVVLGGLSMGGYVALAFARQYPARLRALMLADTRAEPDNEEGKANRDKLIAFAKSHTAADVIDQLLPKLVSDETRRHRPQLVEAVRRLAAAQPIEAIVAALQALRDRPDATPHLTQISVPTLVIVGGADALTPPYMARTLANGIPGAHLAVINDAGHLSNLEKPDEFNVAVRSLLQSLP